MHFQVATLLLGALSAFVSADPILDPRQGSSMTMASSTAMSMATTTSGLTSAPFGGGESGTTQPATRTSNSISVATPQPSTVSNTANNPGGAGGQQGGGGEQGTGGVTGPSSTAAAVPGVVPAVGWELGLGAILGLAGIL
ncbi:hypothetical protein MMC10_005386 [Thelotrema lepadinum]|nr:hypothetical protein [Thelotrema lepadinum]